MQRQMARQTNPRLAQKCQPFVYTIEILQRESIMDVSHEKTCMETFK